MLHGCLNALIRGTDLSKSRFVKISGNILWGKDKCVENDFIFRLAHSLLTSHSVLISTLIPIGNLFSTSI